MTVATPRIPKGTADRVVEQLFPTPAEYEDDPIGWMHEVLREETWSKSEEIFESVVDNRYTAVKACHDSSKSHTASRAMAWWIDQHPAGDAFVVSTAPSQTQVEAILWREVGRAHRKGELVGRITYGMVPAWKIGQEIVGYGRKPQDLKSKEEAMAAFQGIHSRYVLVVIDEAGGVPRWLYDAVDTLATNEKARVLAIGNPDDPSSHFAEICKPGSGWNVIHIPYDDTPNFTDEDVSEDLKELLISRTWVRERQTRWGIGSPLYTSKVLGDFPDISDDTLLSPKLLRKCQENELPGSAKGRYGVDIARMGDDETCIYRNRGGVIRLEESHFKQDTMTTAGQVVKLQRGTKRAVPAVIDADGLGAGVYDRLKEQNMPIVEFRGGQKARDPDRFINRRAEAYWIFREDCENGDIDLPPPGEDDELMSQLGSIRWKVDSRGRIGIESKDDMKKRGMPSPDRADAAVYSNVRGTEWPFKTARSQPTKKGRKTGMTGDLLEKKM